MNYLFLLFSGLLVTACGGGTSNAPSAPLPHVDIYPLLELRILVIGQSISSNCNGHIYGPVENVFQIAKDGSVKPASDPFEWADCGNGSMWMPLGKKLIESGVARKVIFMPIGMGGTKVEDWQRGGAAFGKLNNAIALIQKQGVSFDLALWHQGSSNAGTDKMVYTDRLTTMLDYVNSKISINRWIIAVHSRCGTTYDRNIELAQIMMGNMPELKRYIGPNNNLLGNEYRFDDCHLNYLGQEKMASMWFDSIKAALK
ncbi:sialate O-acetylesterase [Janthinobacterium sp. 64]|uniref:sialate O-acetylesterase n=1 Tax=Janthinobacterium sp. 64 TaxID=2035208 RepID=UPI000C2C195A|nr:sialate O-acetylesterase [Janthinobacterium sp. 64]PKB22443.1 hypothetical protein CLU91_2843 [Janthinobacterium sp. 64]